MHPSGGLPGHLTELLHVLLVEAPQKRPHRRRSFHLESQHVFGVTGADAIHVINVRTPPTTLDIAKVSNSAPASAPQSPGTATEVSMRESKPIRFTMVPDNNNPPSLTSESSSKRTSNPVDIHQTGIPHDRPPLT